MVTDFPEDMPGLHTSAVRFAQSIRDITDGRIRIEVFPAGALVRPFETLDAVSAGVADMYFTFEPYFATKSATFHFFSAVPFGMTAIELFAWVHHGGGQDLWDTLTARFNTKSLLCSSTGSQMGGWFTNEMDPEGFKGLRYRMGGPGAEILRRLGTTVVVLPGGEIMPALKSGAIDAAEWIGPWLDMAIGLHKTAGYYYYPAFHEPGTAQALGINKGVWESFSPSDRRLFETAAACEYTRSLGEFNANNALALRNLRDDGAVQIRKFDDSLLSKFLEIGREVIADIGAHDDLSRRIYTSYEVFRTSIMDWSDVGERAFMNARRLA
jgi:TRAP-type mannitol/chloroaromatic compound transport system substrate-binding protein